MVLVISEKKLFSSSKTIPAHQGPPTHVRVQYTTMLKSPDQEIIETQEWHKTISKPEVRHRLCSHYLLKWPKLVLFPSKWLRSFHECVDKPNWIFFFFFTLNLDHLHVVLDLIHIQYLTVRFMWFFFFTPCSCVCAHIACHRSRPLTGR